MINLWRRVWNALTQSEIKSQVEIPLVVISTEQELLIKKEIDLFNEFVNTDWHLGRIKIKEKNDLFNNVCAKCGSDNVNDRIREKDVEVSVRASSYGGYGSSAQAKYATTSQAVSKCNSCQHEWIKKDEQYQSPYSNYTHLLQSLCRIINKDPNYKIHNGTYHEMAVQSLIPHISIESVETLVKTYDLYYRDYGQNDLTYEALAKLGFKTLEENHGKN